MPTTFTGLVLFVAFLSPGLIYLVLSERGGRPTRDESVLREAARLILASVLSNTFALCALAAVQAVRPTWPPDVRRLIEAPKGYWSAAPVEVVATGVALLAFSCLVSYIAGAHMLPALVTTGLQRSELGRLALPPAQVEFVSAWQLALKDHYPDHYVRVRCHLLAGGIVEGWLDHFNNQIDETGDRELILAAPLEHVDRQGGVREVEYGAAVVPGRSIEFLEVNYVAEAPD